MEGFGKLPEFENTGWVSGGFCDLFLMSEDDRETTEIKEEMVEEVMQELRKEINSCYSDHCYRNTLPSPASLPVYFHPSPFVVVGGDNERCGPAFSGSAASMMAGIGMGYGVVDPNGLITCAGGEVGFPEVIENGSWVVEGEKCVKQGEVGGGDKMDVCNGREVDDDWLTRLLLSWGPQELEDLTD